MTATETRYEMDEPLAWSRTDRVALRARWLVANRGGRHVLVPKGEVVFEGATILHAGAAFEGEVDHRYDFGNAMIGPGFVDLDALADLDTSVLEFDNQPGHLKGRIASADYVARGMREAYSLDELAFQKRYAFAHLLKAGITTGIPIASLLYREWAETIDEFEAAADAAIELGLRVYLGPAYRSGHAVVLADGSIGARMDEARGEEGLRIARRFSERMENRHGGLIRTLLAPDRIENCTPDLIEATALTAAELGVPVRMHACQSHLEVRTIRTRHGCSPIELLARHGLLSERLIVPHMTHVAGSRLCPEPGHDLALFRDSGASVVHCPILSARQGEAIESLARYRASGINVGLGTDTWPPNMVENGRTGILLCRVLDLDPQAFRGADMYEVMTLGGAAALGRSDIGRLAPGCLADITVFSLSEPHLGQVIDPIQTMFVAGNGSEFSHVIVDGRLVVMDGQVIGFDEDAARRKAQCQFDRLLRSYPNWTPEHPPLAAMFPPSFPIWNGEP